jgi:hypothetical protein
MVFILLAIYAIIYPEKEYNQSNHYTGQQKEKRL